MKPAIDFVPFPKISRLSRAVVISEKIDGTNAQVYIDDTGTEIFAGSRTRWIEPGDDNYGFAAWVQANKEELLRLGPGSHFGEWWGQGIQRNYGLKEKRFSLFNTFRWSDAATRPECCSVVPILWEGTFGDVIVSDVVAELAKSGSTAAPGFMNPEGVVVFHAASGALFKKTCEKDERPKGQQAE